LTTGAANDLDLGSFAGGTSLTVLMSGHGDLVNSTLQVSADGSLYVPVPSGSPYAYANAGATNYPTVGGGDGINHFAGGGLNYDATGSEYGFAGAMSTDTTNPAVIRLGAVVGTFSANPTRSDWFLIGLDSTFVVPGGGAHLYVAVNDDYNPDNHGTYSGILTINSVPEPASLAMVAVGAVVTGGTSAGGRRGRWPTGREPAPAWPSAAGRHGPDGQGAAGGGSSRLDAAGSGSGDRGFGNHDGRLGRLYGLALKRSLAIVRFPSAAPGRLRLGLWGHVGARVGEGGFWTSPLQKNGIDHDDDGSDPESTGVGR
jgi:hypothetical protein